VAWRWFSRMWPVSWWRWTCSERVACSFILPRPSGLWADEENFLFTPFLRIFQQPNPFCCNRSTTNLFMISFLSRTLDFFFLSLWIYFRLAKTSQQPISQTTWLKVTPHCNHYAVLQCHKQHCAFFPFQGFFCRCYKSVQQKHSFYMFYIRSLLAVARFDWWLYL
jgi:hypothetical protein